MIKKLLTEGIFLPIVNKINVILNTVRYFYHELIFHTALDAHVRAARDYIFDPVNVYQSHDIFFRFFSELKFCPVTSIPPSPNSGIAGKIPVKRTRKFREKLNQDKKNRNFRLELSFFMRLSTYIGFHESTFYYCFFRLNSRYSTFLFLIKKKIVALPHTQVVECSKKPSSCYLHVLKHNEKIISVTNVIDLKWMLKSFFKMHRSKYRYMYEECSRTSQNVISE